jgi:hypothetical protein
MPKTIPFDQPKTIPFDAPAAGSATAQAPASNQPLSQSVWASLAGGLQNFSQGVAKGELSTLKGLGTIGQTVLDQTAGRVINAAEGNGFTPTTTGETTPSSDLYRKGTATEQAASQALTPEGAGQSLGYGTEKLAEFFAPAGAAARGEQYINTLASGINSPVLAATARVAGKSAIQGAAAGGVRYVQTGGDTKQAIDTAITAGTSRGAFATIGEGARAINLPERLYSTIFKNTASDMMQELRTESIAQLSKENPEKYAQFVKQGIITQGTDGPQLNETIAKQALDAGLRGSIRNMARTVINGALDSEQEVHNAVRSYSGTVDLSEPQFKNVLLKIGQDYQDVGFNEISDEANRLAGVLKETKGHVSAEDALSIRRLLDRARIASSFDKPASALSQTQSNLKTLADSARSRLNSVNGIGDIMKKYSFYIDAMDTLAKEAARRGNNQAISLIDSLFLSSAFGGVNPALPVTAGTLRKVLLSGPGTTMLAQLLNKGAASAGTIGTTGALSAGATSLLNSQ